MWSSVAAVEWEWKSLSVRQSSQQLLPILSDLGRNDTDSVLAPRREAAFS